MDEDALGPERLWHKLYKRLQSVAAMDWLPGSGSG